MGSLWIMKAGTSIRVPAGMVWLLERVKGLRDLRVKETGYGFSGMDAWKGVGLIDEGVGNE